MPENSSGHDAGGGEAASRVLCDQLLNLHIAVRGGRPLTAFRCRFVIGPRRDQGYRSAWGAQSSPLGFKQNGRSHA
jgi:nucleoside-diphosphate-sugar epimerase